MAEAAERRFDLNIEKILEGWETCHAVREIIANALDEQVLTNTKDVEISKDRRSVWPERANRVATADHRETCSFTFDCGRTHSWSGADPTFTSISL